MKNLISYAPNTWCPGCGNFAIQNAVKSVLTQLEAEGVGLNDVVMVSGIGCHAKIVDYFDVNSFYSLHGRPVAAGSGIKMANPKLKVICHSGDGDSYGEGIEHLIFAAKRNIDITVIVHDNRVYGLTTGQSTPTSPHGYKGRSTPYGNLEDPFNPLDLMMASGATYVARASSLRLEQMKRLIKDAIQHRGFAIIDTLQICYTYNNLYDYYEKRIYEMADHDPSDYEKALGKIREWSYNTDSKIPLGLFYKKLMPTFEEQLTDESIDKSSLDGKLAKIINRAA